MEILSINIKYTLKDLKDFSLAKTRTGILNKISLTISVLLTIFIVLVTVVFIFILSEVKWLLISVPLMILPIIITWGLTLLPGFMLYQKQQSDFKRSKLLGLLQCLKISEDRMDIYSENGSFSLQWNDVYKVQELKPCIIIQSSPGKIFIIPRRCFCNQEQLDLFINILDSKVDKKKTKLKRYKLRNSMPDYGEIKVYENTNKAMELKDEQGEPIIELQFSLSKNEYIAMNFWLYYTKPVGLIITVIGIILMVSSIRMFSLSEVNSITPLLMGIAFTFLMPVMLYSNSIKRFKRDAALQKPYTYKFYEDCFVVEHPSGTSRIRFGDLVKVTEIKTAVLFFVTTQIAHIIPKRVLKGREYEFKTLKDLAQRKVTSKTR